MKNVIESQNPLSKTGVKYDNLATSTEINMICVPSIFYGSEMQKESVELNYYITGTFSAQLKDVYGNGELINTYGPLSGSQSGIVLYNQGLILLTASSRNDQRLGGNREEGFGSDMFFDPSAQSAATWLSFGTGIPLINSSEAFPLGHGNVPNNAYEIKFKGTNKIPTVTMLAHANTSELNYSNNPTFIDKDNQATGSIIENSFVETPGKIKNIKDSGFTGYDSRFENVTYISKIGIYDEHKNLIGIASLANPVKKSEYRDYMFKLRLDF